MIYIKKGIYLNKDEYEKDKIFLEWKEWLISIYGFGYKGVVKSKHSLEEYTKTKKTN